MKFNAVNVIDILLAVIFLMSVFRGWRIGLVMKAGHLAAMVCASIVASIAAEFLKKSVSSEWVLPYLEKQMGDRIQSMVGVEQGISYAAENISFYLLFGIVFVLALLVLNQLVRTLKIVDYIPVVGTINKLGGAVISFLIDFIFFFILGRILFGLIPMESWAQAGLTKEVVEGTYLLRAFVPW